MTLILATESAGQAIDWAHYCELLAGMIAWLGVTVLVYGVARSAIGFVRLEFTGSPRAGRNRVWVQNSAVSKIGCRASHG